MIEEIIHTENLIIRNSRVANHHLGSEKFIVQAEVKSENQENDAKLEDAHQWRDGITIRSSLIEVSGFVSKIWYNGVRKSYLLNVDNLVYLKPDELHCA